MVVSHVDVINAANEAISHKGYPYSRTEFDCVYYLALSNLLVQGATKEQIQAFKKLVDNAPIKSGRFNNYSGD